MLGARRKLQLAALGASLPVALFSALQENPARPSFDVASIRPNNTINTPGWTHFEPAGVNIRRASLINVIAMAYRIPGSLISADDGMRDTLASRYDIVAKTGHEVPRDELLPMLQTLLSDRFRLTLHRENKVQSVYRLVVAKGGPKLRQSQGPRPRDSNCAPPNCTAFRNIDMWTFASELTGRIGRPVLDFTGLQGAWDFTLRLDTEGLASNDPELKSGTSDWSLSSIFTDLEKQLGLRLESDRAPVETLVIDRVDRPSEN